VVRLCSLRVSMPCVGYRALPCQNASLSAAATRARDPDDLIPGEAHDLESRRSQRGVTP
jgi:hypothetical protein